MKKNLMMLTVAKKECVEVIRDGRLRLLSFLFVILGIAALGFGVRSVVYA